MNTKEKKTIFVNCPLRKKDVKKILPALRKLQRNVIHTQEDFYNNKLIFELECKLEKILNSQPKKGVLKFSSEDFKEVSNLLDRHVYYVFKGGEKMSDYMALYYLSTMFLELEW